LLHTFTMNDSYIPHWVSDLLYWSRLKPSFKVPVHWSTICHR